MARHKSPDGRRVPVSFKLTEDERDLVDSLRGETERSVWLRDRALAAAREENSGIPRPKRPSPASQRRTAARLADPKLRRKPDEAVGAALAEQDATPLVPLIQEEPDAKPCKHKGLKLSKGVCPDCKEWAVKP